MAEEKTVNEIIDDDDDIFAEAREHDTDPDWDFELWNPLDSDGHSWKDR